MPISSSPQTGAASVLRKAAGLVGEDFGAPMDVMWFRLPRLATDTDQSQARFDAGHLFVMLQRGDYWQCAYVIPKGGDAKVRAGGLDAFRKSVGRACCRSRPIAPMPFPTGTTSSF